MIGLAPSIASFLIDAVYRINPQIKTVSEEGTDSMAKYFGNTFPNGYSAYMYLQDKDLLKPFAIQPAGSKCAIVYQPILIERYACIGRKD